MKDTRKIAIYLRLSVEDDVSDGRDERLESNSIFNQRKMLLEYISNDDGLKGQEIEEFCDDGFSGTNMDRPGMQELLDQVKKGKIGCILVKDMSRFARDYIELGDYLNQIFPFMGVRFIAVNDHYDSREHEGSITPLDTAFQTLLYDLYSKDVSVKVKTSFQNKCANGEYVFGQVPFGYAKSRTEKNVVIVNEKEAVIVRHIFSLAEQGMGITQIAKALIREKTPTITQMRYPERMMAKENHTWSSTAVRTILNNRFYLGEMAYGKTVRKAVGSKGGLAVPKGEWKVIADHHEPLVTPEVFALVSSSRLEQSTRRKRPKHPLTGKIYCGGCGYSISYKPQGNSKFPNHFWCRKHSLLQIPDCCTYFNAAILEEIVLAELYRELMRRGDLIKQRESLEQFQREELHRLGRDMENSRMQYRSLQKEADVLYESYALKQMGVADYRSRADGIALQMQELTRKIEKAEQELARLTEEYHRPKQDMKDIIRFAEMKELTQEMVDVFIKKVTVYKGRRVEIEWNYALGEE
ncbi:MAG: recombinase family protein [Acetatifactor muris]|nr:recombinase family protein [Acetatifactor muris]